jgi:hypothetical protein
MHVEERVNEILSLAKDVGNKTTERRLASIDLIEYKENRSWIQKSYELGLKACQYKSLNLKVVIYQKDQMKYDNLYYFMEKSYDFKEDEEIQVPLEKVESQSQNLQIKLTNMRKMEEEMINFNPEDYTIPRFMMRLKKSVYPGSVNVYDDLIQKGEV